MSRLLVVLIETKWIVRTKFVDGYLLLVDYYCMIICRLHFLLQLHQQTAGKQYNSTAQNKN